MSVGEMMAVRAKDVRVDDYLFAGKEYYNKSDPWVRVTNIRETTTVVETEYHQMIRVPAVEITTTCWTTIKCLDVGVAIKRPSQEFLDKMNRFLEEESEDE